MTDDSFAIRLRQAREAAGMTQYRLAKEAGLTQSGLAKLESGNVPRLDTAFFLARALGLHLRDLLPDDPEKNPATRLEKTTSPR